MINIAKGIVAGLVASAAVAGPVFLASWSGVAPAADPVNVSSGVMLSPPGLSWVVHFAIGTFLWGPLLAMLSPIMPFPFWFKGVVVSFFAWLIMHLVIWSANSALFLESSLWPILVHLVFGAILGSIYGVLLDGAEHRV